MDEYKIQIQARSMDETVKEEKQDEAGYGWCAWMIIIGSVMLVLATFPVSIWFCLKTVQEYERAVIFRLGRLLRGGAKGPGLIWFIPYTDSFSLVDLRTVSFSVPPQEVLSKDSVAVMVDAIVYYRIFDPVRSVVKVKNVASVTHLLAQTTLRNILGTRNLSEIVSDRMNMAQQMERPGRETPSVNAVSLPQGLLFEASQVWGVKVERVEFKDVRLPSGLQRMMAAEAEAVREAKAKVIAAEGELNASHALRDAASVMKRHPTALQLRYLQTLTEVASEHTSTIFFPVPINLMTGFVRKNPETDDEGSHHRP
ncbi:stomatin-like isoform X1 [Leucoraja erinacea]|uniref:stomatin-like isoform X1 n=1 Tax=Leucoraja erinaceus TaxID=7782 RepID=UPI002453DB80|nr:stomatin-like isoform X1 [Leucoraja erinacea]